MGWQTREKFYGSLFCLSNVTSVSEGILLCLFAWGHFYATASKSMVFVLFQHPHLFQSFDAIGLVYGRDNTAPYHCCWPWSDLM